MPNGAKNRLQRPAELMALRMPLRGVRVASLKTDALGLVQQLNSDVPVHVKAPIIRAINGRSADSPHALNDQLGGIRFTLRLQRTGRRELVMNWSPDPSSIPAGYFTAWAPICAIAASNLAREGALWSIRQCRQCEKWYVARRHDQRFCSVKCNQKS